MNIGRAIRLCRTKREASQGAVARQASCSVSYLSMLENNKRDPTLSTLIRVAQALQVPVGLLFFLASEQEDLGPIDEKTAGDLMQSILASLAKPTNATAQTGEQHG
ncbi:helix-turn-helix domain-containing protein [Vulcaniibacterium tengchongense]|uniref:Transcriptional regulator with XRE-family HTH domain n=1 Tax=Vulcaniibacterium tengchongense TaxID=1273429 RepID=A0A3N4VS84_9GAMM|nr:helix-turn-helix transcriptional regulator [Vulcaniibacterium tengchongense]RPE82071.1 transcriptional regulator with XRE-family HTH domain [Vulcaniibacterium tengchongense]